MRNAAPGASTIGPARKGWARAKRLAAALLFILAFGPAQSEDWQGIGRMADINGWLWRDTGSPADWLGLKYQGRILREPINLIIVDPYSTSEAEAVAKLMAQCKVAGYEEEYGHSAGYCGEIDGKRYRQIPNDRPMAFANKDFFQTNNHGRIMSPALIHGAYVFIGAFSTERPSFWRGIRHLFVSFNRARDDFSAKMDSKTLYRIQAGVPLGNLLNSPTMTTADHDGKATVLVAQR